MYEYMLREVNKQRVLLDSFWVESILIVCLIFLCLLILLFALLSFPPHRYTTYYTPLLLQLSLVARSLTTAFICTAGRLFVYMPINPG